ncbi:response regulator [Hymenobacter sp. ASUV-10]|uniref:Response regulator n=1 Tax=Hymenobacter aranciens TaxID=3063996 RepID=A0ABT9B9H8_9BACT|nr:response regulator [Hymenobacter sp. ASUV-10]MDO7874921.1 response regulator [Hymenobacter sp. ASUV-10]
MEKLPHILLVDDDDTTNFLNEHLLKKLNVTDQVRVAYDGKQALEMLSQLPPFEPALLLLDVNMPVMDGIQFLETFARLPQAQQAATVIVMLTTSMDSSDLARINDLPIAGMVSKPLNREKIDMLLKLHFQRQLPGE